MEQKTHMQFSTSGRSVGTWFLTVLLGSAGFILEMLFTGEAMKMMSVKDIGDTFSMFFLVLFLSGIFTIPSIPVLLLIYTGLKKIIPQREIFWIYLILTTVLVNVGVTYFVTENFNMGSELWELLPPYIIASFIVIVWINRKILLGLPVIQQETSL